MMNKFILRTYEIPKDFYHKDHTNIDGFDFGDIYNFEKHGMLLVRNVDDIRLRKIVYKFALFFRREFSYDFVQYSEIKEEDATICRAFIFQDYAYSGMGVGACCFRKRRYADYDGWCLQWIWLHPFFRDRGLFTKALPLFKKMFGDFYIEPPFSKTMDHIVNKVYGSYKDMLDKTKNILDEQLQK